MTVNENDTLVQSRPDTVYTEGPYLQHLFLTPRNRNNKIIYEPGETNATVFRLYVPREKNFSCNSYYRLRFLFNVYKTSTVYSCKNFDRLFYEAA